MQRRTRRAKHDRDGVRELEGPRREDSGKRTDLDRVQAHAGEIQRCAEHELDLLVQEQDLTLREGEARELEGRGGPRSAAGRPRVVAGRQQACCRQNAVG